MFEKKTNWLIMWALLFMLATLILIVFVAVPPKKGAAAAIEPVVLIQHDCSDVAGVLSYTKAYVYVSERMSHMQPTTHHMKTAIDNAVAECNAKKNPLDNQAKSLIRAAKYLD